MGNLHTDPRYVLHQWLLAGWGMPIGEMFDLERLARECELSGRWSFFISSVPLKVGYPCYYSERGHGRVMRVADDGSRFLVGSRVRPTPLLSFDVIEKRNGAVVDYEADSNLT